MHLAFYLFTYFPYGGLQRDFLRIAECCLARGHTIDVYTMRWEGYVPAGLNVQLIPVSARQNHRQRQEFVRKAYADTKEKSYDLKVGFNKMPGLHLYYAADTCYQAKARNQHGWLYRLTPRYKSSVAFEKSVFSPASKTQILVLSSQQQDAYRAYYGTPLQRFYSLPPGIAKDRVAPTDAQNVRLAMRLSLQLAASNHVILFVGSGFKTKGLDRAIVALASLPLAIRKQSLLYVVGQDGAKNFFAQAVKLGVDEQLKFLGGRDDIPQLMLAADLLIHPAYNENTGTVLLEAIVSGLPVLTTAVCGYASYVIEAKAGKVLDEPFSQTELNKQLKDMLCSSERPLWQSNGIAFAKSADIYSMPLHVTHLIESLGAA